MTDLNLVPSPHRLVYLSRVGSHLFGTQTPASDLDLKGLFLPARTALYLQDVPSQFTRNTNSSGSGQKNTGEDTDTTVWSLQFFVSLLKKGDMNAVSLLFSWTNPGAVLTDPGRAPFLEYLRGLDHRRLLSRDLKGMTGFVYNQAFKYSRKGEQFTAVQVVAELFRRHRLGRVGDVAEEAALAVEGELGERGRELVRLEGGQLLVVNRALDLGAAAGWALEPLERLLSEYGARARAAAEAGHLDFKSFSHSLRVISEIKTLHAEGRVRYPLERADWLRDVKLGRFGRDELVAALEQEFAEAQALEARSVLPEVFDSAYAREVVLALYGESP